MDIFCLIREVSICSYCIVVLSGTLSNAFPTIEAIIWLPPSRSISKINYINTFPTIVPGLVLMQCSFHVFLTSVCLYFCLDFPLDIHKRSSFGINVTFAL